MEIIFRFCPFSVLTLPLCRLLTRFGNSRERERERRERERRREVEESRMSTPTSQSAPSNPVSTSQLTTAVVTNGVRLTAVAEKLASHFHGSVTLTTTELFQLCYALARYALITFPLRPSFFLFGFLGFFLPQSFDQNHLKQNFVSMSYKVSFILSFLSLYSHAPVATPALVPFFFFLGVCCFAFLPT